MTRLISSLVLVLILSSCAEQAESSGTVPLGTENPKENIRIVERQDTIITFDPKTGAEAVMVLTTYDTLVEMVR